jgi:hypothetical protein
LLRKPHSRPISQLLFKIKIKIKNKNTPISSSKYCKSEMDYFASFVMITFALWYHVLLI